MFSRRTVIGVAAALMICRRREFDGGRDGFVTEFHGGGSDQ